MFNERIKKLVLLISFFLVSNCSFFQNGFVQTKSEESESKDETTSDESIMESVSLTDIEIEIEEMVATSETDESETTQSESTNESENSDENSESSSEDASSEIIDEVEESENLNSNTDASPEEESGEAEGEGEGEPAGKSWVYPDDLNDYISTSGYDAKNAEIAMDDSGNAIIVWSQTESGVSYIYKSEFRDGEWSESVKISEHTTGYYGEDEEGNNYEIMSMNGGGNPHVATDNNGNAVIVWSQNVEILQNGVLYYDKDVIFRVEYRLVDGAGVWTDSKDLDRSIVSALDEDSTYPQVAMSDNVDAVVVWQQSDGTSSRIYMSEYRGGEWLDASEKANFISPNTSSTNTKQKAYYPKVAMDGSGNGIAIWKQYTAKDYQMFKSEYRDGSWDHPDSRDDYFSPASYKVAAFDLDMNDNNEAIIVWNQALNSDKSSYGIYKSEYTSGSWTHPDASTYYLASDSLMAYEPQVAISDNGDAVILWKQSNKDDGGNHNVYMSERRAENWDSSPTALGELTTTDVPELKTDVTINDNGDTIVVFGQLNGSTYGVFMSEYRDSSWSESAVISDSAYSAFYPKAVINNDGTSLATWHQSDGSNTQIFMGEYR